MALVRSALLVLVALTGPAPIPVDTPELQVCNPILPADQAGVRPDENDPVVDIS